MKKAILVIVGLLASVTTFAASTGTLTISGTVEAINEIVITPNAASTTLDIVGGESNRLVADVLERSNSATGYKIELSSANASKLVHATNLSKFTGYTVRYDGGAPMTLTTTPQVAKTAATSELVTDNSAVAVDVSAYGTAPAGTYSDVITITISSI